MCPHFGLIDGKNLSADEMVLMRARLHWRGGRRRLRENKTAAGIATIYDALLSGMRWYIMVDQNVKPDDYSAEALENERYVFHLLQKKGVVDHSFDIRQIQELADRAIQGGDIEADQASFVAAIEKFLTRLRVLPCDESTLPPEDPATF
jgi:hypothetical protein